METGKKKAKQSFSGPSLKSNAVPDKQEKAPCSDKKNCKKVDEKSRKEGSIDLKQKKQSPAADGDVRKPRKVVGKSLTNEEYDEIFMAVLQSVSSAERRGEDEVGPGPMINGTSEQFAIVVSDDESDKDETGCEVIRVQVIVEKTEDQKDFDNMENEDIDKWDNKTSLSRDEKEKENNVEQTPLPKIQFTKPDSTVEDTMTSLSFSTKSVKPKTDKQASKRKDICSDTVHPTSTSYTKKTTSSLPKKIGKEKKKESKKPEAFLNKDVKVKKVEREPKISLQKKMSERELEDLGIWVQCVNSYCSKWRYLPNVSDPMALPDRWECRMNTVEAFNSCEKPQERYEPYQIFTKYTEGSVVLAKMPGYPWWPAMVEIDPDYEAFFQVGQLNSMLPTKFHVVFFDKIVSRAWIHHTCIKPFTEIDKLPRKCKGHDYTREVKIATDNAIAALELSLKERMKKYSFSSRFTGKWVGFKSNTDQDNTKDVRKRSKVSRCSKKRKIDHEDNLVDETLNQILNNSQSVISDVAGMLDSVENDNFNSNANSEYLVSKPKTTVKKRKIERVDTDLRVSDARCGDSESMKEAAKFEVAKLDMDIFTMELGSVQLLSQDQLNTDVQGGGCCSTGENVALPDSVITGNIYETGAAETLDTNSAGKKKKYQKKKKSAEEKDKKQDKPNKPKTSGENKVCVKEEMSKKKKKNKGDGTANVCPEGNLEKSKKKTKKAQKTGDSSNRKPGEDNVVEGKMQDKMKGKKSDKSLKCSGGDGKPKSSVLGGCGYNKMKMKNTSNEEKEDITPEIKTEREQRQNKDSKLNTNIGQDKTTKKKKSKFICPVQAAKEDVSNTSSSDKKSGDKEKNTEDKKCMINVNSENTLVKPSSRSSQKEKETEQDVSDDDLDLDFNIPVQSPDDKVDSDDDDFLLDEPNTPVHRSTVVVQGFRSP